MKHHLSYFFIIIFLLISACSPLSNQEELTADPPQHTETAAPTWTVAPTGTQISSTPAPILQDKVCSPLETETLQTLQEIVTQPYKQPRIGIDDGPPTHHGVDFAHYRRGDLLSLEGVGILSALDGEVVTVINDRFPYGHAVIIETPLDTISPQLLTQFNLPEISSPVDPDPKFNWSPGELSFTLSENDYSIYIFYAHLLAAPEVEIGEQVTCGQRIRVIQPTRICTLRQELALLARVLKVWHTIFLIRQNQNGIITLSGELLIYSRYLIRC